MTTKPPFLMMSAAAAVLALSACSTQTQTATAISLPFQALGNEPGWSVKIAPDQQAEVLLNYGERRFSITLPSPEYTYAGTHYRSTYNQQPLALDILHTTCSDTMSDTVYDYEAVLRIEGQELRGCGRTL